MGAIQHFKDSAETPKCLTMADLGFKLAKEIFIYLESKNIQVFMDDRESKSHSVNISDINKQVLVFQVHITNSVFRPM